MQISGRNCLEATEQKSKGGKGSRKSERNGEIEGERSRLKKRKKKEEK